MYLQRWTALLRLGVEGKEMSLGLSST